MYIHKRTPNIYIKITNEYMQKKHSYTQKHRQTYIQTQTNRHIHTHTKLIVIIKYSSFSFSSHHHTILPHFLLTSYLHAPSYSVKSEY